MFVIVPRRDEQTVLLCEFGFATFGSCRGNVQTHGRPVSSKSTSSGDTAPPRYALPTDLGASLKHLTPAPWPEFTPALTVQRTLHVSTPRSHGPPFGEGVPKYSCRSSSQSRSEIPERSGDAPVEHLRTCRPGASLDTIPRFFPPSSETLAPQRRSQLANHAPSQDISEGYAADWTMAQLHDAAQRIADRIDELVRVTGTESKAAPQT